MSDSALLSFMRLVQFVDRDKAEALFKMSDCCSYRHPLLLSFLRVHFGQNSLLTLNDNLRLLLEHSVVHKHRQQHERQGSESRPITTDITHDVLNALDAQVESRLRQLVSSGTAIVILELVSPEVLRYVRILHALLKNHVFRRFFILFLLSKRVRKVNVVKEHDLFLLDTKNLKERL